LVLAAICACPFGASAVTGANASSESGGRVWLTSLKRTGSIAPPVLVIGCAVHTPLTPPGVRTPRIFTNVNGFTTW
jgi:hypothetical protein